jgi:hypothetical protein
MHTGHVRARQLTVVAVLWAAGYLAAYVVLVAGQGGTPAWWYVGVLCAALVALVTSAAGVWSRPGLVLGGALLGVATIIALLSIGLLLLPAVAAIVAAVAVRPSPVTDQAA